MRTSLLWLVTAGLLMQASCDSETDDPAPEGGAPDVGAIADVADDSGAQGDKPDADSPADVAGDAAPLPDDGGPDGEHAWEQVVGDGFGSVANNQITEFQEFGGFLYAGTGRSGTGGAAEVWRSPDGDSGTWTQVTDFTPALTPGFITSFATSELGGGVAWMGSSGGAGASIYRSTDGESWTRINRPGFGVRGNVTASPHMVLFKGPGDAAPFLYAGAGSHGGETKAEVYRTPWDNTDPTAWTRLVDFETEDPTVTTITYFYVYKGKVYFGTTMGQIWESSDGVTFTQNAGAEQISGRSTIAIASMVEFEGLLYAATCNKMTGGQLWRTADGTTWSVVTPDAFGRGTAVEELHNIRVSFGRLWITAYTKVEVALPSPLWSTQDGERFEQMNEDGFGHADNMGPNPVTVGFGDHQYHGGPNSVTGGQIWRLRMR